MRVNLKKLKRIGSAGRYLVLALLLGAASFLNILSSSPSASAAVGSATSFSLPVSNQSFSEIGLGPDGNIWYTGYGPSTTTRVGKLTTSGTATEYLNRTIGSRYPRAITAGPDGNVWYSEQATGSVQRIIKMTSMGTVLGQYTIPGSTTPTSFVVDSSGDLWFAAENIGKVTTSGVVTTYPKHGGVGNIQAITLGPDGNIWYVASNNGLGAKSTVGKMTTTGTYTGYLLPNNYNAPSDIVTGTDGNLWFILSSSGTIVKATTSGVLTPYYTTGSFPQSITVGSDGNLWYVSGNKVGRVTTAAIMTEFTIPVSGIDIIAGPDGAVWVLASANKQIVRVATELTNQTISFTSIAPAGAVVDGVTYSPTASATSGLPVTITIDSASSSVCSIDGSGVVSFQNAGTCTINANQAGDLDYKPALQVQQVFTVLPVNADTSVVLNCPTDALINEVIDCTVVVTNNGPAATEDLSLVTVFPTAFSGASVSGGGVINGQQLIWSTASLASQDSVTFTLTGTVTASASGKLRFNAALVQTSPDPNILNNIDEAIVEVN